VVGRVLAEEHGADPGHAEDASVQLAHLAEYVGLLYPLDDPPLVKSDVVEVARLIVMFRCRCPVDRPSAVPLTVPRAIVKSAPLARS